MLGRQPNPFFLSKLAEVRWKEYRGLPLLTFE
jgi:hypothetical protein